MLFVPFISRRERRERRERRNGNCNCYYTETTENDIAPSLDLRRQNHRTIHSPWLNDNDIPPSIDGRNVV